MPELPPAAEELHAATEHPLPAAAALTAKLSAGAAAAGLPEQSPPSAAAEAPEGAGARPHVAALQPAAVVDSDDAAEHLPAEGATAAGLPQPPAAEGGQQRPADGAGVAGGAADPESETLLQQPRPHKRRRRGNWTRVGRNWVLV